MRCKRKGAWSLIELLTALVLLSAAIIVLAGIVDSCRKNTEVHLPDLMLAQISANMSERYAGLSLEELQQYFGDGTGGSFSLAHDSVLNSAGIFGQDVFTPWSLERSIHLLPATRLRPAQLLSSADLLLGEQIKASRSRVLVARGGYRGFSCNPLQKALSEKVYSLDLLDGKTDFVWPRTQIVTVDELIAVIARRMPHRGRYSYETSKFGSETDGTTVLFHLRQEKAGDYFLLREHYFSHSFLMGRALRGPWVRRLLRYPGARPGTALPKGRQRAIVLATKSRVFLFFAEFTRNGELQKEGQMVFVENLSCPWLEGYEERWERGLEQVLQSLGCSGSTESDHSVDISQLRTRLTL